MRRESQRTSPRVNKRGKPSENPLGDESDDSEYQSPSTDPNQTNYSFDSPRRNPESRKRFSNTSTRSPRDMELTRGANRSTRSSAGTNRTANQFRKAAQKQPQQATTRRKQTKPRRHKNGVQALKEIRKLQGSTHTLIPKLPFSRVVREVMMNRAGYSNQDMRITREALMALQEASEMYLVNFFEDSLRLCIHAKRVTLMPRDMQLIALLRNNWGLL